MGNARKFAVLGIVAVAGYSLWKRFGHHLLENEDLGEGAPSPKRIQERSELTAEESAIGSDDPVAQATAILTESDERSRLPRSADGVERRRSEDTVEP